MWCTIGFKKKNKDLLHSFFHNLSFSRLGNREKQVVHLSSTLTVPLQMKDFKSQTTETLWYFISQVEFHNLISFLLSDQIEDHSHTTELIYIYIYTYASIYLFSFVACATYWNCTTMPEAYNLYVLQFLLKV